MNAFRFRMIVLLMLGLVCAAGARGQGSSAAPERLTLEEAIRRGLQANLNVLLAASRVAESEGVVQRRTAAAYLPRVTMQAYSNYQNRNLRAFGIAAPGLPEMVGPFGNDAIGLAAQQNLLDLSAIRQRKASLLTANAARCDEAEARDAIVRTVAAYYLNAQAQAARAVAAQSRVTEAEALFRLAKDRHEAGAATGVDVLRAQVQLANDRQAQLAAVNESRQALLALERSIGMEPGALLELAEPLHYVSTENSTPEALAAQALRGRSDLKSLEAQRAAMAAQIAASRARYYPRISLNGNYGGLGRTISGMQGVGLLQAQADFTLLDRDREGEAQQLAAQMRRLDAQIADQRRGVLEGVRSALLQLESASAQVAVAEEGLTLAQRELLQARDRFEAGATNNIEVVTAQDSLARAEENRIVALSRHADARFALERALGGAGQAHAQVVTESVER